MKLRVSEPDLDRMRDQLYFEGTDRRRKLSRFWLLLLLAGVIASTCGCFRCTGVAVLDAR